MIPDKKITQFENNINYTFKNKLLLINSLTHPSFLAEKKKSNLNIVNDFERLEF